MVDAVMGSTSEKAVDLKSPYGPQVNAENKPAISPTGVSSQNTRMAGKMSATAPKHDSFADLTRLMKTKKPYGQTPPLKPANLRTASFSSPAASKMTPLANLSMNRSITQPVGPALSEDSVPDVDFVPALLHISSVPKDKDIFTYKAETELTTTCSGPTPLDIDLQGELVATPKSDRIVSADCSASTHSPSSSVSSGKTVITQFRVLAVMPPSSTSVGATEAIMDPGFTSHQTTKDNTKTHDDGSEGLTDQQQVIQQLVDELSAMKLEMFQADSKIANLENTIATMKNKAERERTEAEAKFERELGEVHEAQAKLEQETTELKTLLQAKDKAYTTDLSELQHVKQMYNALQETLNKERADNETARKDAQHRLRIAVNSQALRGAAHLVAPNATTKLPRKIMECSECYIKNLDCDGHARCRQCTDRELLCRRWRCSMKHKTGECYETVCAHPHDDQGWLMRPHIKPQW